MGSEAQSWASISRSSRGGAGKGQDLKGLEAEEQRAKENIQQVLEVFQSKAESIRKQEAEYIEEQGNLTYPNV
ncbi:unnamed protein product, partial [Clonostachys chloroleuca]